MRVGQWVGLLAFASVLPGAATAQNKCADDRQRVVVVGIQSADEAVRGLLGSLTEEFSSALQATGCYDIFTTSDISVSLRFDGMKAEFGCSDDKCRAALDKEFQRADIIAAGELRPTSDGHQLTLVMLDAVSRQSVKRYGPTPPTKSEVEHRNEIRKGARVMCCVVDPPPPRENNTLAVLTMRDPAKKLEPSQVENLTTVVYVELAQSSYFTLVPRDRMVVLEAQLRDPKRVAQEARAQYLLDTELLTFSDKACGVAGTLYDLEHGVTKLATRVRAGCSQSQLADAMESLAGQILGSITPPERSHWPAWVSFGAAAAAGTVGAIFFAQAVSDVEARNKAADLTAFQAADVSARDNLVVSNIGFGIACAATAAGVTYVVVTLLSDDDATEATPRVAGAGAAAAAR